MRTKLMTGFVILAMAGLIGGIIYIYTSSDTKPSEADNIYNEKELYTYVSETVDYLTFADDLNVEGVVTVEEDKEYIEIVEFENKKVVGYNYGVGEEFNVGDCLYEQAGKKILAENNLRLVDIDTDETVTKLSFLNYDNLCIETEVDYENYKKIQNSTKVEILFDDDTYIGDISYIDYVLNDNKVKILVDAAARLLPGTNVKVRFIYEEEKEFLCVSSEFVTIQGGKVHVQVNVGTADEIELEDKSVTIGKTFEIVQDGHTFTYYEVLEGLQAMDEIYMRVRAGEKIE